ncbi:hypothetical protein HNQ80_003989 [Anaerosolibacter carboniphilus]|uniref:SLH domain-containing protein n=1 Tax=Anaerosolibacter carboniphilus TaxID=1417629 RepID=A0A841KWW0_9FIRM|nr:S-layer homology domain-containing protein [Anaerosolibacter carboniphilus]MBB6217853.1 hypothetical protein [Anaerosolibacter carboniphilus]
MAIKSKMISLGSAAVITLTLAGHSFAAAIPFTDLGDINAKEKILVLQEKGYVKGVADGLFAPNSVITAAEGIQLIVNALELNLDTVRFIKEPKATDYYTKANDDAWYAGALIIAAVNGLEFPNDLDPSQEWTREEFTYHLIKAVEAHSNLPMIKIIPADITDGDQITMDYSGAIQRALIYGVVQLDAEGKFNPRAKISREEAAGQIYNVLEYIKAHPAPAIDLEEAATE